MEHALAEKLDMLKTELRALGKTAVAFSGGVDSAFLLKTARSVLGENLAAFTVCSPAFPARERTAARTFCAEERIPLHTVMLEEKDTDAFSANPPDRCYHCKRILLEKMLAAAGALGFSSLCEGSNADDTGDYRPGLKAAAELGVKSPLLDCGLRKAEVRALARQSGIAFWDKPSSACLASRIPYGEPLTKEKLEKIERAENFLQDMGFRGVRVRLHGGNTARIECAENSFPELLARRKDIVQALRAAGFVYVTLDLQGYRTGSMNEVLGI